MNEPYLTLEQCKDKIAVQIAIEHNYHMPQSWEKLSNNLGELGETVWTRVAEHYAFQFRDRLKELEATNEKHVKTLKIVHKALVKTEQIEDIEVMADAIEELAQTITVVLDACTKQSDSKQPCEANKTE